MSHGGGEGEDDLGAAAWPGFVDILSSVLIMFVFFLMITAVALSFHVALFKGKMKEQQQKMVEEQVAKELKKEATPDAAKLMQENKELKEQIKTLEAQSADAQVQLDLDKQQAEARVSEAEEKLTLLQQAAQLAESKDQKIMELPGENAIVVFFGIDAISLTPESKDAVVAFLKGKGGKVEILSSKNTSDELEITSRKVAVARMLNARNSVIQAGFTSTGIAARIVNGEAIDGSQDWVKIVVKP